MDAADLFYMSVTACFLSKGNNSRRLRVSSRTILEAVPAQSRIELRFPTGKQFELNVIIGEEQRECVFLLCVRVCMWSLMWSRVCTPLFAVLS